MTSDQIKKTHARAPFRAFKIHLSDQRSFEIRHAEYLWVMPGGKNIAIADDSGSAEIIDLNHVTSLKVADE